MRDGETGNLQVPSRRCQHSSCLHADTRCKRKVRRQGWCDCQGGWLVRQEKSSKAAEDVFPTDLPETLFNNRTPKYIIRRFKLVIQTR